MDSLAQIRMLDLTASKMVNYKILFTALYLQLYPRQTTLLTLLTIFIRACLIFLPSLTLPLQTTSTPTTLAVRNTGSGDSFHDPNRQDRVIVVCGEYRCAFIAGFKLGGLVSLALDCWTWGSAIFGLSVGGMTP